KSARLDSIRNYDVLGSVQFLHSFDNDAPRAGPFDFRPHLIEEIGEIAHFRLCRCPFDDGDAIRQCCGHHDVVRSEDGWTEFASQINHRPGQPWREYFDVAVLDPDRGAEAFKALEVQIDRAIAYDTAARQGNGCFFASA